MNFDLLKIKPCDTTFFRSGDRFSFDINKIITSKNTPYPSVFFGAIFTAILTENNQLRENFFNNYDHEKILNIGQIYLFNERTGKTYIKAPLDLFYKKNKDVFRGKFYTEDEQIYHSLSYEYILKSPEGASFKRADNVYIDLEDFNNIYSKNKTKGINIIKEDEIFSKINKIGIGIDKNYNTAEYGKLYKTEMTEFKNLKNKWSYIVEYYINEDYLKENYPDIIFNNLKSGYLKLGGENKISSYSKTINSEISNFNQKKELDITSGIYKLILTTESYFEENIAISLKNLGIEILGLSSSKPIYISGYDMKEKKNKKIFTGYSPGTVFLIRSTKFISYKIFSENFKKSKVNGFNNFFLIKESE